MAENPKPDDGKLTPAQIENWRRVLFGMLGPIALILSAEDIQKYRDKMQAQADKEKQEG